MKKGTLKIASVLLTLVMLLSLFPAAVFAEDGQDDDYDPYDVDLSPLAVVESVTPVGEPYAVMKLTFGGYVVTDWYVPEEYDVVLKDGTALRVSRPEEPSEYYENVFVEYRFSVDAGEETIELIVYLSFDKFDGICCLDAGQVIQAHLADASGQPIGNDEFEYYYDVFSKEYEAQIDEGSAFTRLVWRIRQMIERIRSILWLFW